MTLEETTLSAKTKAIPKPITSLSLVAVLLMTLIQLLWAGSDVASKLALAQVGPYTLTVLRFLPSGILLLLIERVNRHPIRLEKKDFGWFFTLGFLAIAVTYAIFYTGIQQTTASETKLLTAAQSLLVATMAVIFLRERLRLWQWVGLCVGLMGVWLIAGAATGNLIALAALMIEASTGVIGKRLTNKYRGLQVAAIEMLIGSAILLPFAIRECVLDPPQVTREGVFSILYLSCFCSFFCYGVWYRLLEKYPVSLMGAFILMQPVCGPIFGWLFRGETLKPMSAIGGSFVIVGLVLTTMIYRKSRNSDT